MTPPPLIFSFLKKALCYPYSPKAKKIIIPKVKKKYSSLPLFHESNFFINANPYSQSVIFLSIKRKSKYSNNKKTEIGKQIIFRIVKFQDIIFKISYQDKKIYTGKNIDIDKWNACMDNCSEVK